MKGKKEHLFGDFYKKVSNVMTHEEARKRFDEIIGNSYIYDIPNDPLIELTRTDIPFNEIVKSINNETITLTGDVQRDYDIAKKIKEDNNFKRVNIYTSKVGGDIFIIEEMETVEKTLWLKETTKITPDSIEILDGDTSKIIINDLIHNYSLSDFEWIIKLIPSNILKGIYESEMDRCVEVQDYINAAVYRDKIKEL